MVPNSAWHRLAAMDATAADGFYARARIVRHEAAPAFWDALAAGCGTPAVEAIASMIERRERGDVAADDVEVLASDVIRQSITVDAFAPHTWSWINMLATVSDVHAALDLGCGGGVVTCFIAMGNPEARVVGVDANSVAIDTARALARDLGLVNVEFRVADFDGLDLGETFDLVVSSAVWAETEPWVHAQRWWSSVNQLPLLLSGETVTSALAQAAARHLDEDGVYLSLERCRDLAGLGAWVAALQDAGVNFDATISDMLTIDGVLTGSERLPMVAAHRRTLPAGAQDIIQWRLRVGDVALDEALMAEMVMAGGGEWSLAQGRIFDASEDGDDFSAALLLVQRGDEGKLYFTTTRGVREILASSPDGGAEQFALLYQQVSEHLGERPSVVGQRDAEEADLRMVVPRLPVA